MADCRVFLFPNECDFFCWTCTVARKHAAEQSDSEPIEVVDEEGIAHGYTDEDDKLHGE
jgi:hypothetical protein